MLGHIEMADGSASSAHVEDGSRTTSPLRPHHAERLINSRQFQSWELRTRSYISSFEGYGIQLLDPNVDVDEKRQEHILHFPIQIVHEEEDFSNLRAIEGSTMVGTRREKDEGDSFTHSRGEWGFAG